ncbi:MAG: SUKH-3 domain-containing protein [Capnocytophaga sp.]|nr:SUKH-3 domain-containing protein [Capnocytophaga sp.]
MISKALNNLLKEKNIHIDTKIPKDIFDSKQNHIIALFKQAGYENLHREIILFLCFFDEIIISHKGYTIEFNISKKLQFFTKDEVSYLEKISEKTLFPIGIMQSGWYDLFADENGAVYAIHIEADEIILYGETPFLALENILKNNKLQSLKL